MALARTQSQIFFLNDSLGNRGEPYRFDAVPLLTVFLALACFIPARWVLPGLGAAGRPASIFGIGLFALWLCIQLLPNITTQKTPLRWVLFIDAVVLLFSYAFAHDRGLTSAESLSADRAVLVVISVAGVVLMASEGLPSATHVTKLTKRLTYMAGIVAFFGIVQWVFRIDPFSSVRFPGLVLNRDIADLTSRGAGDLVRVKSSTLHPIEFAVVMALALPLALHHALHEPNRILRNRRYALVALIGVASLLAVSRSAVIAVAAAGLMMLWAWSPQFRLKALAAGFVGLIGLRVMIPGLLGTILALFENWNRDVSISGRTDDYDIVAGYLSERPLLGRGLGTFLPNQYIVLDNAYLLRAVSTGVIGLATLLLLLTTGFLLARRAAHTHPNNVVRHMGAAIMAIILTAVLSAGTFDFYDFPTASSLLFVALGCGAVLSKPRPGDEYHSSAAPPGLLRLAYRAEHGRRPWWHRFDPELKHADPSPSQHEVSG